jgi:hypothetical protein
LKLGFPPDVSVDNLVTNLKNFDVHLLNALDDNLELVDLQIKARVRRLNHIPFIFTVTVKSDYGANVAFRMIFGHKIDWFGQHTDINGEGHYIVEIHKLFAKDLYL